jgi:chromosome segregation ATPase
MQLVRAFLSSSRDAHLKEKVDRLASLEEAIADTDRRGAALRAGISEHRRRIEDLKAQLAAVHGVRTAYALTTTLQAKQKELGEEVTKATADLAALDEKQLLARIELQDDAEDLTLDGPAAPANGVASRGE